MNKKNIFLWTLYDFANSIAIIVFALYFSQWLVVDRGVSDFWFNMIFSFASILLFLTAPILGSIADKNGQQQKYLNWITIISFFVFLIISIITLFFTHQVFLAVLFLVLANYFYQFSFVFYNALLHYIAPPEKWGKVSGIGEAGNLLGEVFGLLITLPLASGAVYLFGEAGRAQTFLPATVLFFILALPMLLFFKLPKQELSNYKINFKEEYKNFWNQFKDLIKSPGMGLFLLAYFFFNDAIVTSQNNFPIYVERVFGASDGIKSMLLIGILLTSVVGAFCTGLVADKIGLKRTLSIVLGSWVVILPLMGIATSFPVFIGLSILMGFFYGSTFTVSRATMTALCPKEKLNFGFSFYTLAERFSTLFGPVAWGLITSGLIGFGPIRYRIAVISMAVFVVVGVFLLRKVKISIHK